MEPGTSKLHLSISGVDLQAHVNGGLKLVGVQLIKLEDSAVNITNITLDVVLEGTPDADQLHWSLADQANIHFGGFKLEMKNKFMQWLVNLNSGLIAKVVNSELKKVPQSIDKYVQNLDANIKTEEQNPFYFVVPVGKKGAALNLTMTHAPESADNLVKIFFDGLFLKNNETFTTSEGIATPPRLAHNNSEQVWLHQRMINTLLDNNHDKIYPLHLKADSFVKEQFPQIVEKYGEDCTVTVDVDVDTHGDFVSLNKLTGWSIEDRTATITFVVENKLGRNEIAAQFQVNLSQGLDLTIYEFVAFPKVKSARVDEGEKILVNNINLPEGEYNVQIASILNQSAQVFNKAMEGGWPLANLNPQLGMLGGLLKKFTVTPHYFDEFLFVGFSMYADMPTSPSH